MKTLVTPVLAIVVMGSPGYAADPEPLPESEWSRLDREIGELASTLNRAGSETNVGGLVRAYYITSSDKAFELDPAGNDFQVNSGNDIGGFHLGDADVFAEGSIDDRYDWRISFDIDDGNADLEDAYGRVSCGEGIHVLVGSFKTPILQSNRVAPENQLMLHRTFIGQIFDTWDNGAMATGSWGDFQGSLSAQNGFDSAAEDLLVAGRAEYNINGGTGQVMGAWGADSDLAATVGGMWLKDESDAAEGDAFGADVTVTSGIFSYHGEIVHIDGPLLANSTTGQSNLAGGFGGGGSYFGMVHIPINYAESIGGGNFRVDNSLLWNSTVSVLLEAYDLEVGFRIELYDDPGNTRSATLGANWYRNGRNAMWQGGITQLSSNDVQAAPSAVNGVAEGLDDATILYFGLSVGTSTKNI